MLNGTLCATERALCCIVENYQTPEVSPNIYQYQYTHNYVSQGLQIPEVLQPYMGGKDFLPFTKELPKMYQRKK